MINTTNQLLARIRASLQPIETNQQPALQSAEGAPLLPQNQGAWSEPASTVYTRTATAFTSAAVSFRGAHTTAASDPSSFSVTPFMQSPITAIEPNCDKKG